MQRRDVRNEFNLAGRVMDMGVDSMSDVFTLSAERVKPAPEMGLIDTLAA